MKGKILKYFLLSIMVVGIFFVVQYSEQINTAIETWVSDAGAAGPVVFVLIYIVGTVFFLPGSVLTLAGGALFGPVWGTFYNLTGATIGAIISFITARYLAKDFVERKSSGHLNALREGVDEEGWRFVAFVRLVPIFPFNVLNYALGLTHIKLSHYAIATYICMLPGAIAYTYLGYVGREAVAGDEAIIQKIMLGIALIAIVSFLPSLIKKLRAKPKISVEDLKAKLDIKENFLLLDVRTEQDYNGEQGHIEGAINIPLDQLDNRINELTDFYQKSVVTICRTDRMSAKAALILAKKGFTDVSVAKQGMTAWNNSGYPKL